MKVLRLLIGIIAIGSIDGTVRAESPYVSSGDFEHYARQLRESALLKIEPKVEIPTQASPLTTSGQLPWKRNIVTTVFWVGEASSANNPTANFASSWDAAWWRTYGGYDNPDPSARTADFRPVKFIPQQNPFYFALPYNDVTGGHHKPEANKVIPWFREAFREDGVSVLKDRWICIRNRFGIECYAQWGDCGPFRTDHSDYVFGNERPKPNLNKGAGLDVSPSCRDFLKLQGTDVTDWKFVEWRDVPPGPWRRYGDNNHWVQYERYQREHVASVAPTQTIRPVAPLKSDVAPKVDTGKGPRVDLPTNH